MFFFKKKIQCSLILLVISSCTWVKLTPIGEDVKIVSTSEIAQCEKKGTTTVSLLSKVAGIRRNKEKVTRELITLGKNSAAEMGGDTIVAVSEIANGEQTFDVYKCYTQ